MMFNLAEATTGEVVAIAIGPNKKVFRLHKDILCRESEYFRTAYNGRWKEAEEGVTLEDVEVEVFKIFVRWLYTQQTPDSEDYDQEDEEGEYPGVEKFGFMLLKACIFANRFLVADFERITHNLIIDHFLKCQCAWYKHIIFAYENLPEDSLVLKLMVELQCLYWSMDDDDEKEKRSRPDLPKEFLIQVMGRFAELRGRDIEPEELRGEDFYMRKERGEAGK
ncbi:hypothetical protein AA0119_g8052 [Alternaria tenuissima]|uniref:BTB domain-containing protein n=1 Tax=Alternaria tenuissima TaxID=119927 RepID=A0ABY0G3N1_9PLEO|nr:hypothetical protein B0T12DRAFT_500847 [Alternaria alternata]RYN96704.1 hypothetical protein AA0119_g8052 [Alternaria tenuissima]RYO18137.1 hypothetical protein AA0121_g5228 [Alternaria tenuissima]